MVDASWVSSLSPVLLIVVVAGEVEVHVEALHDGQDLDQEEAVGKGSGRCHREDESPGAVRGEGEDHRRLLWQP